MKPEVQIAIVSASAALSGVVLTLLGNLLQGWLNARRENGKSMIGKKEESCLMMGDLAIKFKDEIDDYIHLHVAPDNRNLQKLLDFLDANSVNIKVYTKAKTYNCFSDYISRAIDLSRDAEIADEKYTEFVKAQGKLFRRIRKELHVN